GGVRGGSAARGGAWGGGGGGGAGAGAGVATGADGRRRSGCATTVGGTVRDGGSPSRTGRNAGAGVCPRCSGMAGRTNGRAFAFGVLVRRERMVVLSRGRPGWAARACSRAANGTGAAAGCRRTITSRVVTLSGGRRASTPVGCARTLCCVGVTRAAKPTTRA